MHCRSTFIFISLVSSILLFSAALILTTTRASADGGGSPCSEMAVVCGEKHGASASRKAHRWGHGHFHQKFYAPRGGNAAGACRPSGGYHCGSHRTLQISDMPANSITGKSCYAKATARESDGCSWYDPKVKFRPDDPKTWRLNDPTSHKWAVVFKTACQLHDACYSTRGAKKADCDKNLWKNMKTICSRLDFKSGQDPAITGVDCRTEVGILEGSDKLLKVMGAAWDKNQRWAKDHCPA